jgi:hypothetical protein
MNDEFWRPVNAVIGIVWFLLGVGFLVLHGDDPAAGFACIILYKLYYPTRLSER